MKKTALIIVLASLFVLSACSANNAGETTTAPAEAQGSASEPVTDENGKVISEALSTVSDEGEGIAVNIEEINGKDETEKATEGSSDKKDKKKKDKEKEKEKEKTSSASEETSGSGSIEMPVIPIKP